MATTYNLLVYSSYTRARCFFFVSFRRSRVFASLTKLYVTKPECIHILVGLAEGEARVGSNDNCIFHLSTEPSGEKEVDDWPALSDSAFLLTVIKTNGLW